MARKENIYDSILDKRKRKCILINGDCINTSSFVARILEVRACVCVGEAHSSWGLEEQDVRNCNNSNWRLQEIKNYGFLIIIVHARKSECKMNINLYSRSTCSSREMNRFDWLERDQSYRMHHMQQRSNLVLHLTLSCKNS